MFYLKSKRNFIYLKAVSFFLFSFFLLTAKAQNDAVMVINGRISTTGGKSALAGSMGVKTNKVSEDPVEGVDIEVKKNGVTIAKVTTSKKGKYSFQIPVSTTDSKNEYTVYISKEGMVPKMVNINAYLSQEEFAKHPFVKYDDFELDLPMLKTTVKDIVLDKPSAKIKWDDVMVHKFTFDQAYAKIAQKEELKMTPNPDLYFKNLAKKKKKEDETLSKNKTAADAKLKADEEAKKKADEEAKRLAELKAKEEADRIQREKAEAEKQELLKKHIADSLAEVERKKALEGANAKVEIKKIARPIPEQITKSGFEGTEVYDLNVAQTYLKARQTRMNKEKGKNISAKYETNNILTSLLNMVDENDKKMKRQ